MNWKKFILLIGSCVVLAAGIVWACADSTDPYDEYPSFFFNNVNNDPAFKPFYFTTQIPYYTDWYEYDTASGVLPDQNIAAWYEYTGKHAAMDDIDSLVYKYTIEDLEHIEDHLAVPDRVKDNSFTKWLVANDKEALTYLIYAKQCEFSTPSVERDYDEFQQKWRTQKPDTAGILKLEAKGISAVSETKSEFIKERYKYQALRMTFYCNRNTEVLQLYQKLFDDKISNTVIGCRCLGMKAGALFRLGRNSEAAYLYSLVFDRSDELKLNAHISFSWATPTTIDTALQYCKNNHERSVIYIMKGLYEAGGDEMKGLSIMEQAYHYDPAVRGLSIVMTREMNKAEQRYLAANFAVHLSAYDNFTDAGDSLSLSRKQLASDYTAFLKDLNVFAQKVASEGKNGHIAYWHLASAYIYYMQGDGKNCKKYLDLAATEKMTDMEHDVHELISALYIMQTEKTITSETEIRLLPSLQWIEQRASTKQRFKQVYADMMTKVLASAYLKQKDTIKAIFCISRAIPGDTHYGDDDFTSVPGSLLESMSPAKLELVETFAKQAGGSAFEKWLVSNSYYSAGELRELEGTKYIRLRQFGKAAEILASVPDSVLNQTMLPDILISHIADGQDWGVSDSANKYTKLSFARKMNELEQLLAKNPNDSRAAYHYANALYCISYYGKGCHAQTYYRHTTDENAYLTTQSRLKLSSLEQEYYSASLPEKYYLQAFSNSTDPEFKARCLFLAAKCWQKNCPEPKHTEKYYYFDPYSDKSYYYNSLKNPYFKQLKEGYRQTKFYTTAENTCSYFDDYLKKN